MQSNNVSLALPALYHEEVRLFGGAVGDEDGAGQGVFLLRICRDDTAPVLRSDIKRDPWLTYLAGPGIASPRGYTRDAIQGEFEVECLFRRSTAHCDVMQIAEALWLLGVLGGVGARARRGWGSLSIQWLSGCPGLVVPKAGAEISETLSSLLTLPAEEQPPYSAFSTDSRIDLWSTAAKASPMSVLSMAGHELLRHRGFGVRRGNSHVIGATGGNSGERARQNFASDHQIGVDVYMENDPNHHPERIEFGLPNNMFFSSEGFTVSVLPEELSGKDAQAVKTQRRASPLLMHVHQFPDESAVLLQTFLPAKFLPEGMRIAMQREKRKEAFNKDGTVRRAYKRAGPTYLAPVGIDWSAIRAYLNAHDAKQNKLPHEFPARQTLWPPSIGAPKP